MTRDRYQTHSILMIRKSWLAALLPIFLLSGCGNDAQTGMRSGKSLGRETTQSRDADGPSMQLLDGSYSIKFLQPTLLKASPEQSSKLPSDKKCGIPAGLHLAVYEKPVVENSHWFVKIKGNPQGCGFSEGYVYEQHAVVPELARANYTLPLPGAVVTSTWCTCRNIGTSPHIGLDLAKNGTMNSYALSGSYVQSVVFNGGCGWEVTLRDDGGAVWLYRHLNRPALQRGQKLKMGDYVGVHQSYPDSSCGNGAHLHLERLTSGAFGDKSMGRTCQYGYTTCNYNPRTPFVGVGDQGLLSAISQVDGEFKDLGPMVDEQQFEAKEIAPASEYSEMGCQPMQAQPASSDLLLDRDFVEQTKDQALASQVNGGAGRPELGVKTFGLQSSGQEYGVLTWQMAVRSRGAENSANRCSAKSQLGSPAGSSAPGGSEAGQLPCIVGYEVYVEDPSGALLRVASEQNSRNRPVSLTPDSRFCLLTRTSGRYAVRAQLSSGASIVSWGNIAKAAP